MLNFYIVTGYSESDHVKLKVLMMHGAERILIPYIIFKGKYFRVSHEAKL